MATIQLKRSNTAGANPTTSNLALGELGINTKDGKFFLRKHVDGNTSGDTILTYAPQGINPFGTQTYVTKVVSKTAAHPYNGSGSSSGYTIDGLESPYLLLVPGNTYKFDQADSSNSGHPLRFYLEADKTTAYTTGVTTNGTPGASGAYTQIVVAATTPQVLYYQCSAHAYMGSASYSVSDAIADGKVGTAQLAANAVTSTKIAANSVDSSELVTGSIDTIHIGDLQVTSAKIANNTIATGNIADNAVDATKIASNSILTRHIDDNQVTADQIADATITTTQIAANTIATANVADNAIDGTKIASNSILTRHIDDNQIGIDQLNVTDGTNGQVLTTDGAGSLSFSTVSGGGGSASNSFETIAIAGQSNVVADSSTDTLTLAAGTGITLTTNASTDTITITGTTGLSANSVTATEIATGAVGPSELAATSVSAGAYTNADITVDADGRITAASNGTAVIADGSITTAKIADDAVTADKLADTSVTAGTYGSTTVSPQITVDAQGRITSVSNQTIAGGSGGSGGIGLNQTVSVYEGSGDGSTTAFDTGTTINAESLTWVFVDGVYQEKGTYSTSGSTVTFSTAPPNGTSVEINNLSNVTTGGAFNHNAYNGDGSTTDFTLSKAPGSDTDLIVFIDGVYQNSDAFNVSSTTLSFDTAPANSTKVIAYTIGGVVMGKTMVVDTFNGDASTTAFTLSMDPTKEENTQVYVGGVYQPKGTYSLSGTTLTFSEAPPSATGNIEVNISQVTTLTEVGANSVTATSIAANAVGSAEIAANSVDSSELVTGSIDTIHIGDDQVTNAKLAVNSVSAVELAGNSVTSTQIAANQVTSSEIASGSVGTIHIANNAILTQHIDDDQVTGDQLADAITVVTSVTTPLVDAAIVDGENFKINGAQGTDGQLLTSTGSGVAWEDAPAGGPTFKTFGTDSIMIGDTTTGTLVDANYNTGLGVKVFNNLTTGDKNTAVGYYTMGGRSSGSMTGGDNTAIGYEAMPRVTSGQHNTSVGAFSGEYLSTGQGNTYIGYYAGYQNFTGSFNSVMGRAAFLLGDGSHNVAIGRRTLQNNGTKEYNTALGNYALSMVTTGGHNTGLGYEAGRQITTGSKNVIIGSYDGNENGLDIRTSSNNIVLSDGDANIRMYIDNTGNVGIAAIPSGEAASAHVVRLGDRVCISEYDDGSNPEQFNLFHNSDSSETYIETGTASVIQQRAGEIIFKNAASGSAGAAISFTERMRIDSSGNVKVGSSSVRLGYWEEDTVHDGYLIPYNGSGQTELINSFGTGALVFKTGTSKTERMRISSSGNVSIGDTNPSATANLHLFKSNTDPVNIGFQNSTRYYKIEVNSGDLQFFDISAYAERMRIDSSGNLLVGATSGSKHIISKSVASGGVLEIINTSATSPSVTAFKFTGAAPNNGTQTFFATSDTSAYRGGWLSNGGVQNYQGNNSNLCDEREKKNIEDLSSTWDCVKSWNLRKFHYNEDEDLDDKRLGVIAQEVEVECPEVITEWKKQEQKDEVLWTEEDELPEGVSVGDVKTAAQEEIIRKGVKEQQMYWMAIKALQEAMTEIEDLKARIETLENA